VLRSRPQRRARPAGGDRDAARRAGQGLVYTPDPYGPHAIVAARDLPGIMLLALGDGDGIDLEALAAEPVAVQARPADLASIQLSGASTGAPKAIPRDFRPPPFFTPDVLRVWEGAVQLLCTQLSRVGGTVAGMILAGGGRVVLRERFEVAEVLRGIERHRATFVSLVPSLLYRLLDCPLVGRVDTSSLRSIVIGGRTISPEQLARTVRVFGPVISQDYGSSESGRISTLTCEDHLRPELLDTVGRPLPGVRLDIRDPEGEAVPEAAAGEIWVRGPSVMAGYHDRPDETAQVLRDGWYRTGDLGRLCPDGHLV
jgi:fatty-acyl-CoA synthase